MKKILPFSLLVLALGLSGCAWVHRHTPWHHDAAPASAAPAKPATASAPAKTIITPDTSLAATVVTANKVGQYAILNFPEGQVPRIGAHLFLYRNGLKTAEVKVVGPQKDTMIVADIVTGDVQAGDTVRDQ